MIIWKKTSKELPKENPEDKEIFCIVLFKGEKKCGFGTYSHEDKKWYLTCGRYKEDQIEFWTELNYPEKDRRVKCAALRHNGRIYVGKYHGEIFTQEPIGVLRNAEQGFLTDDGEFVDRIEGLRIAEKASQIVEKHPPYHWLMSEDFKCEL